MPGGTGPCSSCCKTCFNRAREQIRTRRQVSQLSADTLDSEDGKNQVLEGSGPYLQQVMPGWLVHLTWCQTSIWVSLLALLNGGLVFAAFFSWSSTTEVSLDYTECVGSIGQVCRLTLEVKSNLTRHVYLYYGMKTAYFNHRRIQTSWSMRQMLGLSLKGNLTTVCKEHAYRLGKVVLPCGALPNAVFNDTIRILGPLSDDSDSLSFTNPTEVSKLSEGISWTSVIKGLYRPLSDEKKADTIQPLSWPEPIDQRYKRPFSDAEDLHIWLQTPAFNDFRKASHRLPDGLPAGRYRLVIGYNYPVQGFGGKKQLIIANKSLMGGKNLVLLVLFAATTVCYLLLAVFTFIQALISDRLRIRRSIVQW